MNIFFCLEDPRCSGVLVPTYYNKPNVHCDDLYSSDRHCEEQFFIATHPYLEREERDKQVAMSER